MRMRDVEEIGKGNVGKTGCEATNEGGNSAVWVFVSSATRPQTCRSDCFSFSLTMATWRSTSIALLFLFCFTTALDELPGSATVPHLHHLNAKDDNVVRIGHGRDRRLLHGHSQDGRKHQGPLVHP